MVEQYQMLWWNSPVSPKIYSSTKVGKVLSKQIKPQFWVPSPNVFLLNFNKASKFRLCGCLT